MTTKTSAIKYKKIASGTEGMMVRCSLWLGDDHLLAVRSSGYIENYARFYMKDIGGLVWLRTSNWLITNVIFVLLILLLIMIGASTYDGTMNAVDIFLTIIGIPLLIAFFWNLFKGPTCSCQIITPLGPVNIPAANRVNTVKSLLKKLRPLIQQHQGSMPRSELLNRYDALYNNNASLTGENRMP
jgi:hypothetical protein